jgi:hypothetical protein
MAQEEPEQTESAEGEQEDEEESSGGGQKIMCFVSKKMVPINETEEVEYKPRKKVRVMPKFIKYDRDGDDASA